MEGNHFIFYTPEKQYPGMPHGEMCGDIMPFYHDGRFILFFLYKYCIYAVETKDFVHYGKCRLVLQNGSPEEQDWHAATGSVFYHNNNFYFYYTGFCEGNRGVAGKHEQAILRAVSSDLQHWTKDKDFHFCPDAQYFGDLHWRDPHVFFNEDLGCFCMLVTAMTKDGARLRNGCTAVYVSDDVLAWRYYKTIYAPDMYPSHECQDAFKVGADWYMTFSTYSRWWETRYRIAQQFDGIWTTPMPDDMFDGREFYAAKTVSDGNSRYLVGWQSIRKDCTDEGRYVWGGNVVVHRLVQRDNKTLGVTMPDTIRQAFDTPIAIEPRSVLGDWDYGDRIYGERQDGFGWMQLGTQNDTILLEGTVAWQAGTAALGIMLHTSGDRLEKWCQLRIEPQMERLRMDRYNRIDGDQQYESERPICLTTNTARVQIIVSGTVMQAYVNDTALTTRCYAATDGGIGLFVECGSVTWSDLRLLRSEGE